MGSSHFNNSNNKNEKDKKQAQAESQIKNAPELRILNVLLVGDETNKENFYNFIEETVFERLNQKQIVKAKLVPKMSFCHAVLITPNCKLQLWLLNDTSIPPTPPQIVIIFANTTQMLVDLQNRMNEYQKAQMHIVILTNDEQTKKIVAEKKIDAKPVPKSQHEAEQTLINIGDMVCKQYNLSNEKLLNKYHQEMYKVLVPMIEVHAVPVVAKYVELDCLEQKQRNPLLVNFFMQQNQKNKLSFMVAQALEKQNPLLLVEVYLHYKEDKDKDRAGSIFNTLKNLIAEMDINVQPYVCKIREDLNGDPRLQELKLVPSSAEAILPQSNNPRSINTTIF